MAQLDVAIRGVPGGIVLGLLVFVGVVVVVVVVYDDGMGSRGTHHGLGK